MSLSWHDRYVAVLAPDRVALVRRRRGRALPDLNLDAPCVPAGPEGAVAALATLARRPELGRGDLTLLLSSHFVRYLLVPWRAEVKSPEEFDAFAGICCDRTYGDDPSRRILRISRERGGKPRLAAALEADFLAALREALTGSRLRLFSVQPYLAAAFNRLGAAFRRKNFLFLVAEPTRACLLAALDGGWNSVRSGSTEDSPEALADFIERETRLLGLEEDDTPPLFVHALRHARLALPACGGVAPVILALRLPPALAQAADPLLSMAMAAC